MLICRKSVIEENEKSLNTLSTPIFGNEMFPFDIEIGVHLTCIELFKIQSAFKSKPIYSLLADTWACNKRLFLTLFIVEKLKSKVEVADF